MSEKMDEVWSVLASIDVSAHTSEKNKFTYLSWSWAWAILQKHYPDANYKFRDILWMPNGTAEVWSEVTVNGATREMWLAVTDFRNQPIKNPTSDLVANARMRCLTKNIGMFGLGFNLYAKESLPMEVSTIVDDNPVKDDIISKINIAPNIEQLTILFQSLSDQDAATHKALFSAAKQKLAA